MRAAADDLDLHGFAAVLRAHWPSVLGVAGLTLLLGLVLALLKQPEYVSSGVISVAQAPAVGGKGKAPRADPRAGGQDVALLRSRLLAVRVLQALAPAGDKPVTVSSGRVSAFLNRLKISQPPGASVITISYRAGNPDEAARVVNQVIDTFRQLKAEQIGKLFATEKRFVDAELERRRAELQAVERRIGEFKREHGLMDAVDLSMRARQLGTLESQLILARVEAEKANARWREVDALVRAGDMVAVSAVVDSPLVRRFREKEMALSNRIAEMRNEYGPRHPALVEVKTQLEELRSSIRRELRSLARTMKNQAQAEQRKVSTLQQNVDQLEREITRARAAGGGLQELELEAEAIREQYRSLLKQSKALGDQARDLVVAKTITVVSPAYAPAGPVFPTRSHIIALTVAAALLLGLLTAMLAEYFNPRITRRRPVAGGAALVSSAAPGLVSDTAVDFWGDSEPAGRPKPLTGPSHETEGEVVVPIPGDGHGIVPAGEVLAKPRSRFAEAVTALNQRLLVRLPQAPSGVLIVTGFGSVADKVSIAAALATLNAAAGRRVVVADLTRGEAEIHRAFAMSPTPGVADVLAKSVTLTKAFQTDFRTHVTLLARGEHLDGRLAKKLVEATPSLLTLLSRYFDLVIVVARNLNSVTAAELVPDRAELAIVVETHRPASPLLQQFGDRILRVRVRHD